MIGVSLVSFRTVDPDMLMLMARGLAAQHETLAFAVWANADSNASAAAEYRRVLRIFASESRLSVVSRLDNIGYAGGHNRNLDRLFDFGCSAVMVLNNDVVLAPKALSHLQATAESSNGIALVGPVLGLGAREGLVDRGLLDTAGIRWTRSGRHLDIGHGKQSVAVATNAYQAEAVSGACIYVPAEAHARFRALTGEFFDECFLAFREDAELGLRAKALGIRSLIDPRARGLHFRGNPGISRGDSLIDMLSVQNRFLLRWKYPSSVAPWSMLAAVRRDFVVVSAVLMREHTSIPGLLTAWRIRRRLRWKGRRLRCAE